MPPCKVACAISSALPVSQQYSRSIRSAREAQENRFVGARESFREAAVLRAKNTASRARLKHVPTPRLISERGRPR